MPRRSDDPGKGKKKKMKGILRAATRFLRGKKKGKSAEAQQAPAEPPPPIEQEGSPRLLYARDVYAFGADLTTWTPLCVGKGRAARRGEGALPRETVLKREPVARPCAASSWSGTTSSACVRLHKAR